MEETVNVKTKLHLWWTWLRIAVRHIGIAMRARSGAIEAMSFESPSSAKLAREFESSIGAITAVTFAMEALCKELESNGHKLDTSRIAVPQKTNAGFFIGHRLIQVFNLSGSFADALPMCLEKIFRLRNDSVHFESVIRIGTKPHPSGIDTAEELTVFTLEECLSAIKLGRDVILECKLSVDAGKYHSAVGIVAKELAGVLVMLDEVLSAEGIKFAN